VGYQQIISLPLEGFSHQSLVLRFRSVQSKHLVPTVETETRSGPLLADRKMQIFIQDIKNGANIFERVIQMKRYAQTIHSIRSDDVSRR
jgi:hypothetical protein